MNNTKVGVIGLGYVGLPMLRHLVTAGFDVVGFDISASRIDAIKAQNPMLANLALLTNTPAMLREMDYVVICVPTPLDQYGSPDLSCVESAMQTVNAHNKTGVTVCLESTVNAGVTRSLAVSVFEGKLLGQDVFIVYSPEREDPANTQYTLKNTPKIVSGLTPQCLDKGMALYRKIVDVPVPVSSLEVAEAAKCLENAQRLVNIVLMQEYKQYAELHGIDIFEVIDAAATKPFGFTKYYPSVGVGGHCIPVDPVYVVDDAFSKGVKMQLLDAAVNLNERAPYTLANKVMELCDDTPILLVGLTYKPNVPDLRESASVTLAESLLYNDAPLRVYDPLIAAQGYPEALAGVGMTHEEYQSATGMFVVTTVKHDCLDFDELYARASKVLDTTGVYRVGKQTKAVRG